MTNTDDAPSILDWALVILGTAGTTLLLWNIIIMGDDGPLLRISAVLVGACYPFFVSACRRLANRRQQT